MISFSCLFFLGFVMVNLVTFGLTIGFPSVRLRRIGVIALFYMLARDLMRRLILLFVRVLEGGLILGQIEDVWALIYLCRILKVLCLLTSLPQTSMFFCGSRIWAWGSLLCLPTMPFVPLVLFLGFIALFGTSCRFHGLGLFFGLRCLSVWTPRTRSLFIIRIWTKFVVCVLFFWENMDHLFFDCR